MLKVSSINFVNHAKTKNEPKESKSATPEAYSAPYSTIPHGLAGVALAKSLISFKGAEFYQTLNDNYFKLPAGAQPDEYQKMSASNLYEGKDVLVTAPTGTGKTAIAHYVITKNMEDGKRTFYTTPLKALSNEKFRQMKKVYGEENVGLMTGDTKINPQAPIVIMTTEIYRNMVIGEKFKPESGSAKNLENLKTVIFDELHYLGDIDRGGVWEQSIILSNPKTQLLSLSATIGNNVDINNWMSNVKGKPSVLVDVPPEKRHVPLVFENIRVAAKGDKKAGGKKKSGVQAQSASEANAAPDKKAYDQMVRRLSEKDRLPSIFFVFSKKGSRDLLNHFGDDGMNLTSPKESKEIKDTVKRYQKEGKYLGESLNMDSLEKGYAIHNSGLLPAQKELIEELFQKKLIKVVIATETLAAGINMPARTTVISSTRKPTSQASADADDGKRELSANEFHQMAGRAGRRGIDTTGYVYTMATSTEQLKKFEALVSSPSVELKSSFNPDYSFVAGYYKQTQEDDVIDTILKKSLFAYDKSADGANEKYQAMSESFEKQKDVLKDFGFMKKDNTLTEKGELLSLINGYQQIPVIDTIHRGELAGLTPVELAACVGSLANVNEKPDEKKMQKLKKEPENFEHENQSLTSFVDKFDETLQWYNDKRSASDEKFKKIMQNKDVAKHIYAWAELNSKGTPARDNWKELYTGDLNKSIRDEGSLFKEVTQTVDLLKQMSNITEAAKEIVKSDEELNYYSELNSTIKESLKLLRQEPIIEDKEAEAKNKD